MKFLFNKITSKRYFLTLLLFIFINYLFIEKYLSRLNIIPSIVFFGIYIIGIFIIFYVFKKFNVFQKKYIFWVSCLIIFIATIFINNYVDGFKMEFYALCYKGSIKWEISLFCNRPSKWKNVKSSFLNIY